MDILVKMDRFQIKQNGPNLKSTLSINVALENICLIMLKSLRLTNRGITFLRKCLQKVEVNDRLRLQIAPDR